MRVAVRTLRRCWAALAIAGAVSSFAAPALADKPQTVLEGAVSTAITAIPIDFDRDHPEHKTFGKLIFRGGLNLFAKSTAFGGYSALAVDPSGKTLLAISDAGSWLRATVDLQAAACRCRARLGRHGAH